MDYKRLGERIREERLRLHLTQAQLAEDVDISDTYMGAIERGERSLTLDTLVPISDFAAQICDTARRRSAGIKH